MKITTLLENETFNPKLKSAHGLSLFIETKDKTILFDLGPNNYYISNAKKLNIKLEDVDILIISHGHFDHGSGLTKFLKINKKAKVYVSKLAFDFHYKKVGMIKIPIGIKKPSDLSRVVLIEDDYHITDELHIYNSSDIKMSFSFDESLYSNTNGVNQLDNFNHEIYLTVTENSKHVLFSGCSHKGIDNIINKIEKDKELTHVYGGFHLSHYNPSDDMQKNAFISIKDKLNSMKNTSFYTCHCTGANSYNLLKADLKDKISKVSTGSRIEI